MRNNPSFYVHQFDHPKRLKELEAGLDDTGHVADVFPDFDAGDTGSVYLGILLNPESKLTHVCRLHRGKVAGMNLRSVFFDGIEKVSNNEARLVSKAVNSSLHSRRKPRVLYSGLKLTKNENAKALAHIENANPVLATRLRSIGRADTRFLHRYTARESETLILERDALGAALDIAFDSREQLRVGTQQEGKVDSFLALVDTVGKIEDEFIVYDKDRFPDMEKLGVTPRRATFISGAERLDVIHANRNKLETTFGADLIYYHARFGLILCVQYKMLEKTSKGFQLQANQDFHKQLTKIQKIETSISGTPSCGSEIDYRLHSSPFFYKFVSRLESNFADNALCPGLYMPMELVKQLVTSSPSISIGMDKKTITRHFSNSDFAHLVRDGWIGCYSSQIALFETLIRASLDAGRSVLAAIGVER